MKKRGKVRVNSISRDQMSKVLTQGQKEGKQDYVKLVISLVVLVVLVSALYFLAPLVSQEKAVAGMAVRQNACVDAPSGIVGWWNGKTQMVLANMFAISKTERDPGYLVNVAVVPGKVGDAFELSSGDTFDINGNNVLDLNGAQGFTIEMWIKPSSLGDAIFVLAKGGTFFGIPAVYSYRLVLENGQLRAVLKDSSEHIITKQSSDPVPMDVFSHVALIYNAETKTLQTYINGVADSSEPANSEEFLSVRTNDEPLKIFGNNVILDELSLYNRPLSPEEIQAIFNAGSAGKCTQELQCHDGIDNDGDRQADCQDVDCQGQKVVDVSSRGEYQVTLRSDECEGATTTIGEQGVAEGLEDRQI